MFTFEGLDIIAVTARNLCPRPLWEQIPRIRETGITRVILREKDLSVEDYTALAERVLKACTDCGVQLTIHNYPDAARKLDISSLHMPLPLLTAELCREFGLIGTSIHSMEQLREAEALGADYVTAGHIFETDCKKGVPPRGTPFLKEICKKASIPVYAIGGVTVERLSEISQTGAAGACMMSGVMLI